MYRFVSVAEGYLGDVRKIEATPGTYLESTVYKSVPHLWVVLSRIFVDDGAPKPLNPFGFRHARRAQ